MIEVAGLSKEINGRKTIDQLTFLVVEYRWSYYFWPIGLVEVKWGGAVSYTSQDSDLTFRQIEEVLEAVCTVHNGAYAAVIQFVENNGYRITEPFRESYIDGIWNKESEEEWLTEIQLPVEKISRWREVNIQRSCKISPP